MIRVTRVRFYGTLRGNFVSYASVVLNDALLLHDIRLIQHRETGKPMMIAMPSKELQNGRRQEHFHPVSREARHEIEQAVRQEWSKQESSRNEPESERQAA